MHKNILEQNTIDSLNTSLESLRLNPQDFAIGDVFVCTMLCLFSNSGEMTKKLIVTGLGEESLLVRVLDDDNEIDKKLKENIVRINEIKSFDVLGSIIHKQERILVEEALLSYASMSGDLRKSVKDITEQLITKHNKAYQLIVLDLEK